MIFNLQYTFFLYIILLSLLFLWKPQLFTFSSEQDRKKKLILLFVLILVISIVSIYSKIFIEYFV